MARKRLNGISWATWDAALERAQQSHIHVTWIQMEAPDEQTLKARAIVTTDGGRYHTSVLRQGWYVESECDCKAGQAGKYVCKHVAQVVNDLGLFDSREGDTTVATTQHRITEKLPDPGYHAG